MNAPTTIKRALLSVSDKTALESFACALVDRGVELISTGGTAACLSAAGLPVTTVETVTGFPEMMSGRVKTLHPHIHGGILARRDVPSDLDELSRSDAGPIDLVCVNLYPFAETIARKDVTTADAIEQIDIGGPALLRAAAKNHDFVTVVTEPDQYDGVIEEMTANDGATTATMRRRLATIAFSRTAAYDTAISRWLAARSKHEDWPDRLTVGGRLVMALRYGENPHQSAALYQSEPPLTGSVVGAKVLGGKPLSYNNYADAAAALDLVGDLAADTIRRPAAVIVKHANPCGAACGRTLAEAFDDAYAGDPVAAYGGILAVSGVLDEETCARVVDGQKFLEVIAADAFEPKAAARLQERWKNVRLLAVGEHPTGGAPGLQVRTISGGMLVQSADVGPIDATSWTHVAGPAPSPETLAIAAFTWTVVKHLKSNAICIGSGRGLIGAGTGQVDRLTACRLAVEKARGRIDADAVAASDAFFPFPDGPSILVDAGVRCLLHPGGSRRDHETIDLCSNRGVTCLVTGTRHFKH